MFLISASAYSAQCNPCSTCCAMETQRDEIHEHKARLSLPSLKIERSGSENCAPPVNGQRSPNGVQKAFEEVQTAIKASDQLRRRAGALTSREGHRGEMRSGFASPRFHKDLPDSNSKLSWLRQPQISTRQFTRRRMSTGSMALESPTGSSTAVVHRRPDALAQARSLHKEMVQAEERSRQFSLSISKRLCQVALAR